jgi:dipeptidyl aminopeptidase/acylaminoacyl peptidase
VPSLDPARVIRSQVVLEEHDVSADGRYAVVVRRFVAGNRYRSHLWLVPLAEPGPPRQLTSGPVRDTRPRLAPDGRAVAFKRTSEPPRGGRGARPEARRARAEEGRGPEAPQDRLLVLPLGNGQPGRAYALGTPRGRAVSELAWSPDGSRIALAMQADEERFVVGRRPTGGEAPLARRITRIDWRYDETGHVDHWDHVFVVEARRGARPIQLTRGDWGVSDIAWSPGGDRIAFAADPRPDADLRPRRSIWTVDASPARRTRADPRPEPLEVLSLGGDAYAPAWSPDGRFLAAVGFVPPDPLDDESPTLVVAPSDGSAAPRALMPELDRPFGAWIDTDLFGWTASSRTTPAWADGSTIVAVVGDRGRAVPWRFDLDAATGALQAGRPLATGDVATHSLAVASGPGVPDDRRVTVLACLGSRPLELVTLPLRPADRASRPDRRTSLGGRWAARLPWPTMTSLEVPGPGGPIETWVASPAEAAGEPGGPLPTIVDVHGGPLGAWAPAPSIEVVLLCAAGYRVVLPNIRGSATYGRDWIRSQLGDWGGVDAADVHAALDAAVARGLADPDRLGVLGLSYGGFMVNWLVGTTDRFRAAVSENGVTNQVSDWANSDTGVAYNRMALLGAPLDRSGMEGLWRQSPLADVAAIRTPLLLLQAEADQRCPAADNEQLFIALRVLGREVEYVLYPEEHHVYQASGRPDRRIDRMGRMLDWFDRHLRA